jgi:hypothetical protein
MLMRQLQVLLNDVELEEDQLVENFDYVHHLLHQTIILNQYDDVVVQMNYYFKKKTRFLKGFKCEIFTCYSQYVYNQLVEIFLLFEIQLLY